jgi:hypothetical protein
MITIETYSVNRDYFKRLTLYNSNRTYWFVRDRCCLGGTCGCATRTGAGVDCTGSPLVGLLPMRSRLTCSWGAASEAPALHFSCCSCYETLRSWGFALSSPNSMDPLQKKNSSWKGDQILILVIYVISFDYLKNLFPLYTLYVCFYRTRYQQKLTC